MKIYDDSKDKNVATTMVYADSDAGHLFYDEKKTTKIPKNEVVDLYLKGMVIVLDGKYLSPIVCENSGDGVQITSYDGTAAKTFKSSEIE